MNGRNKICFLLAVFPFCKELEEPSFSEGKCRGHMIFPMRSSDSTHIVNSRQSVNQAAILFCSTSRIFCMVLVEVTVSALRTNMQVVTMSLFRKTCFNRSTGKQIKCAKMPFAQNAHNARFEAS